MTMTIDGERDNDDDDDDDNDDDNDDYHDDGDNDDDADDTLRCTCTRATYVQEIVSVFATHPTRFI